VVGKPQKEAELYLVAGLVKNIAPFSQSRVHVSQVAALEAGSDVGVYILLLRSVAATSCLAGDAPHSAFRILRLHPSRFGGPLAVGCTMCECA